MVHNAIYDPLCVSYFSVQKTEDPQILIVHDVHTCVSIKFCNYPNTSLLFLGDTSVFSF